MNYLKKPFKEQKELVKKLSERLEKLKKLEEELLIGQMILLIENWGIVKNVLKDVNWHWIDYIIIKNLSDALNGHTTHYLKEIFQLRKQEMEAQENWACLDDVLNLDSQVYHWKL